MLAEGHVESKGSPHLIHDYKEALCAKAVNAMDDELFVCQQHRTEEPDKSVSERQKHGDG